MKQKRCFIVRIYPQDLKSWIEIYILILQIILLVCEFLLH